MESNVLSWSVAVLMGFEPRNYPYLNKCVPLGEYEAVLDFKIWAKKVMGISCYFTQKNTGVKFQLTVYRRRRDELYMMDESDIDFKFCAVNAVYVINIALSDKGKTILKKASIPKC
ncbi:MAG: hypothetical protein WKF97_06345 [Chitinophagaceae bacterium]